MRSSPAVLAALLCAGLAAAAEPPAPAPLDADAFARIKSLAGTWEGTAGAGTESFPARVSYEVVSNGQAVLERMFAGTPHEMLNVYYLDRGALVAVHYCSAGNQPRFKYQASTSNATELAFDFAGGDNVEPGRDAHVHAGRLFVADASRLE
ncbi:MAG TPA: hypothetical protein VFO85_15965, partial [Vicinamibacteria bacterium]|nr:hypothetical protein [Vicinamibacteria bacterium]